MIAAKVFVGNLSVDTQPEQLRALFGAVGEVVDLLIPADWDTGRPRGFAFVELATPELAAAAIEQLDGRELDGRVIRVNMAEDRRAGSSSLGHRGRPGAFRARPKGSRRNVRARKRSIW